jgi:hypothetical protein
VCWFIPVILHLGEPRQESPEFEASLGYISETLSQKKKAKEQKRNYTFT